MAWGIRISWVMGPLWASRGVGFRFAWSCSPSALGWKGSLKQGWLEGLQSVCLQKSDGRADGGLPSTESVSCHRDGMEVEFSRELGNYSWHVCVVGMYCYCPGLALPTVVWKQVPV